VQHGHDGWTLESYDWNEKTGVATLEYSRVRAEDGVSETASEMRVQPALPSHYGYGSRAAGAIFRS
jgi:hypothetical protein